MSEQMDERFATALRELLVEQVESPGRPRSWMLGQKRWITRVGAVVALAAGGGGIAYATGALTSPPGRNEITALASPVIATGTGTQTVDLGRRPQRATTIDISFTCLTAGDFTFADGSSLECDHGAIDYADNGHPDSTTTYGTISIAAGQHTTTITATPGARWRLIATYASVSTTAWGVNANGQTYGVQNQHGTPDLIAVIATNGRSGYVYADQLNPPLPKSIAQALAQNNAPPRTVTVYRSDGKTPIGKFVVNR
ncbi:MAG: hypothetical protein ACLP0J_22865 [Solirubrobacteraceae bacterium]